MRASTPRPQAPGQRTPAPPRRALRVHVVERDRALGAELARALCERGLVARVISCGEAALAEAAADRPDLVVLAADLPDMSGYAVCSRLRREPETESIPIILTGARADPGTFEAHQRLWVRADAYLHRPFDASAVLQIAGMLVDLTPGAPGDGLDLEAYGPDPEVLEDGFDYLGGAELPQQLDERLVRVVAVKPEPPAPGEDVLEEGFEYLGGADEPEALDDARVCVAGFEQLLRAASRTAPGEWQLPAGLGLATS